jgi:hypothetical protein
MSPIGERKEAAPGSSGSDAASELAALARAVLEDHAALDKIVLRVRDLCRVLRDGQAPVVESARLIEEFELELALLRQVA